MTNTIKVAISSDFLTAFAALPRKVQGKVTEFVNKFRNNPVSPGINYEKIVNASDKKICSVRIDDTYRGIVARQAETGVYLLLWVDHHDEAYAWARKKRCEVNPKSGTIQVFDVQEVKAEPAAENKAGIFDAFSNEDLLLFGLPEAQLPFVRSLTSKEAFYENEKTFPNDAFENLSWLVEGFSMDELKQLIELDSTPENHSDDLSVALERPESMKSFVVVEGEEELKRIMAEPLEKWRVFLHPTQRKIVNKTYSGAARVLGGAGTGKTVVAMHRAKMLAAGCKDRERILFTTFTSNLARDIRDNLKKICSIEEMRRIDVVNLDAWVASYLKEQGYEATIVYDDSILDLWADAISSSNEDIEFPAAFFADEWNRVIVAQGAFSLQEYAKAPRLGRGVRLDRRKRIQVWKVVEQYIRLTKERNIRDINMAMFECGKLIERNSSMMYKHVIVDEGQDLSSNAFRLLRTIAGEEHPNDLFIVGDAHQRIYKNRAVLSKCGINVRGRSSVLRINYRTTEEIRKAAFAVLNGISFDGMDDDIDTGDKCQSLMHGTAPIVKGFNDSTEELEYLANEIKQLASNGVSLNEICLVARTHKLLSYYISSLTQMGIKVYEFGKNSTDERSLDGVRMATMHRVKGLEFKYIFIAAVNNRVIPLASAIDYSDKVSEAETMTSEKCLLYVAMTRAQKSVTLTYNGKKSEFI